MGVLCTNLVEVKDKLNTKIDITSKNGEFKTNDLEDRTLGHTAQTYPIKIIIAPIYTIQSISIVRVDSCKEVTKENRRITTILTKATV